MDNGVSLKRLPGIIRETPGVLRLLSAETLAKLVHEQQIEKIQIAASVEAAMRLWLYCGFEGNPDYGNEKKACENALVGLIKQSTFEALIAWAKDQSRSRSYVFSDPFLPNNFSVVLNRLLREWEHAHGVAAFICSGENYGLPLSDFVLLPFFMEFGDRTNAFTGDGWPIPELRKGIESAYHIAKHEEYEIINTYISVIFSTLQGDCARYLCGESLGLALLTALASRHHRVSSSLACVASGVLDGFKLCPGTSDIYQIKMRAFLQAGANTIFLPESGITDPYRDRVCFLNQYRFMTNLNAKVAALTKRHVDDVQHEVDKLGSDIQRCHINYHNAEKKLRLILQELEQQEISEKHLVVRARAKLHLGTVYCHLGQPEIAQKYILEILNSRLQPNEIALAMVRHAVILTDFFRFEDACSISESAILKIQNIDYDKDLKMRCYGTRGQARMYQALNILDNYERLAAFEDAADDLRTAYNNAELEEDKARDACYIFLAHALHCPGKITRQLTEETRHLCAMTPSHRFFLRAQWLALYRAMLMGIPEICMPKIEIPPLEEGLEWVYATAIKYRGALFAKERVFDKAIQDFEAASASLEQKPDLIGMIRISVLLQAAESLISERPQEALAYLNEIQDVFTQEVYADMLAGPVKGKFWLLRAEKLLRTGHASVNIDNYPQLHFPY